MERVVVALGGNALLRRGADDTFEELYRAARAAAERIAEIVAEGRSSSRTATARRWGAS